MCERKKSGLYIEENGNCIFFSEGTSQVLEWEIGEKKGKAAINPQNKNLFKEACSEKLQRSISFKILGETIITVYREQKNKPLSIELKERETDSTLRCFTLGFGLRQTLFLILK